ncbi:MAG: T9SS type A sorting domain-containing protein [Bacteroidales bacterium]
MKKSLLLFLFVFLTVSLQAQKDTVNVSARTGQMGYSSDAANINISIFPVPVRENYFNIKSEKEFSSIKITNIIGQDIYREKFNDPQTLTKIVLDNPRRGMYLVTVVFSDGMRIVKKIMIEQAE